MIVLLSGGAAFEGDRYRGGRFDLLRFDLLWLDYVGGRYRASVSGIDELDDAGRRDLGPFEPAPALLLVVGNALMLRRRCFAARPDPDARDAEQGLVVGIDRDDGMDEKAPDIRVSVRAEPNSGLAAAIKVDLARILRGNDAPPFARGRPCTAYAA
jgi:hypothetical protein